MADYLAIPPLARELHELADACGIETSDRRCWKVLRKHPDITSSAHLQQQASSLLVEVAGVVCSSVSGAQSKDWAGTVLYKWDDSGSAPSGLIECLVSHALDYLTVGGECVPHVRYTTFRDKRGLGCMCPSFLLDGEAEQPVKFFREAYMFDTFVSTPLLQPFLKSVATMFLCDLLVFNEDRHLGNISLIADGRGDSRLAPVFDMGSALHFDNEPDYTRYSPKPFGQRQVKWLRDVLKGVNIQYNFMAFLNSVDRNTLLYPSGTVSYVLDKLSSCTYSYYVQEFVEVA